MIIPRRAAKSKHLFHFSEKVFAYPFPPETAVFCEIPLEIPGELW